MNLHHLPVVTFDKRISEKQIVTTKDPVNVRKYCHNIKNGVINAKLNREEQIGGTSLTKFQKLSKYERSGDLSSCNVRVRVSKCKGQVLRNRIKDNIERRSTPRQTWSREDTSKKKKKKDGAKPKINLNYHKKNPKRKKNKFTSVIKDNSFSHDDIKVLYTAENVKKRKVKWRKTLCRKKLSVPYIKRPSTDVFKTGNTKLHNIYLYYQFCKNRGWIPQSIKKQYSNPRLEYQVLPLKVKTCKTRKAVSEKILPRPEHYNVVDFSKEDDSIIHTKIIHCPTRRKEREKSSSSPESTAVAAPSQIDHIKKAISKSQTVVPEKRPLQIGQVRKVCRSVQYQKLPVLPCPSSIPKKQKLATTRFFDSMRHFLKYFLIIVALIVWSPCIVFIFISWCLLSRLRPQDITPQEKLGAPCQRFKNKYHRNLVVLLGIAYEKTLNTFNVIKSSFDSKNLVRSSYSSNKLNKSKSESKTQPNPNKRYVLYYSSEKGWLMKPMRTEVEDRTLKQATDEVNSGMRNKNIDDKRRRTVTFSKTPQEQTSDVKKYINQCVWPRCTKKPYTAAVQTSPSHQFIRVCRPRPDYHRVCRSASLPIVNQPRRYSGVCPARREISPCRNLSLRQINHPTCPRRAMRISSNTLHRLVKTYNKHATRPYKRDTCVRRERKVASETKPSRKQKFYTAFKKHAVSLKDRYDKAQAKTNVDCSKLFASRMRNRPMSAYFLDGWNLCKNTCSFCLFMLASLVWIPVFLCCYLSFWLMCQCCN